MNTDEIIERVKTKLATIAPAMRAEGLGPDDPLDTRGGFDSIALIQTALFLESEFGVRVKPADLSGPSFGSLAAIARLVESRR